MEQLDNVSKLIFVEKHTGMSNYVTNNINILLIPPPPPPPPHVQ